MADPSLVKANTSLMWEGSIEASSIRNKQVPTQELPHLLLSDRVITQVKFQHHPAGDVLGLVRWEEEDRIM